MQISYLENGKRKLTDDWRLRLARALKCDPDDFFEGELTVEQIPVRGYVGAGAKIHNYDDHEHGDGLRLVDRPQGIKGDLCCVEVKGMSMPPFKDGWLIFYSRHCMEGLLEDCLNQLCVIETSDGALYLKELVKAGDGKFHLISWDGNHIHDVKVAWAGKVEDIRPA